MDRLTSEQRSEVMSRVRGKDTRPELEVRRAAHALGLRFRLQRRDLPGSPDIVFPKARVAIFVHGCFWHQHPGCKRASMPATRTEFWQTKLRRNVERDRRAIEALSALGWKTAVIWECETRSKEAICGRLRELFYLHEHAPKGADQ